MPPFRRGGKGRPSGGRPNNRHAPNAKPRSTFKASRLKDFEQSENIDQQFDVEEDDESEDLEEIDDQNESTSDREDELVNSYSTLLQTLHSQSRTDDRPRKKRRIGESRYYNGDIVENTSKGSQKVNLSNDTNANTEEEFSKVIDEEVEDEEEDRNTENESDSDAEESLLQNPYEKHYASISEAELANQIKSVEGRKGISQTSVSTTETKRTVQTWSQEPLTLSATKSVRDMHLKRRLHDSGSTLLSTLSNDEKDLATVISQYHDVVSGCRGLAHTAHNVAKIRDISCLHALNHVFKTRDRILKNNTKVNQADDTATTEYRDQGFTRPKVLIIVPTKQACVRFVDSIVKLSQPDQQENKARFLETYSIEDPNEWREKPEDFRQLFGGNHEEDFRIGLKFTRKTIKYFSGFYNSDIILGSPLGLMRTITTGGGARDKKKRHDADFLSSIEVVIMDHANALQMQNWTHVEYVFSQLNLIPKDSHGCDFSRVRNWYLDGNAKYLRQTIILSDFLTPEINSLASTYLQNITGRVKYVPTYKGAMLDVSQSLPITITQTFQRFTSPTPLTDNDARFKYFTTVILPPLLRDKQSNKGVLLLTPSYLDFVRLRNYFSTAVEATSLSFGSISEYTEVREVSRARSHFQTGRHSILLYSERAHHHFRYKIRGVRKIVFYGVPENPIFWSEIVGFLGLNPDLVEANVGKSGKGLVRAMFSKWDAMKVERIVGSGRVGRLLSDKAGDTFDFV